MRKSYCCNQLSTTKEACEATHNFLESRKNWINTYSQPRNYIITSKLYIFRFVCHAAQKKERCTSQRRFGEPRWDFIAWNQQNKTTQLQRRSWNDAGSERVQHKTLRHSKYAYGNHSRTNWLVLKWCLFSGISCEGRRGLMARARLWDEESGSRIWPGYCVLFFVRNFILSAQPICTHPRI